ncbi:MAG: DNA translocase FtsK 4TM domain-containing protein [Gemmobacter sp.]|uniref:DNA translocase FtsK n=1 Tax=Gemmobacter sp. TaxID=1898957 RepID=UPI00391CAC9B
MASYHARQREPLLDRTTQAMVEKRGKELLGLGLLVVALALAAMLGSYSPDDPGWMVATDEPARNLLGRAGAAAASTLIIILGLGAWSLPVLIGMWGLRFLFHRGEDRALGRVIFAWMLVMSAAAYAATHVPGGTWVHSFGLGGLFGDTLVGVMLNVLPMGTALELKVVSVLMALALLSSGLFTMGFDRAELRIIGRFLLLGSIVLYDTGLRGLRAAGIGAAAGAAGVGARLQARRAARAAAPARVQAAPGFDRPQSLGHAAEPPLTAPPAAYVAEPPRGLRARMEGLIRRAPEAEPEWPMPAAPAVAPEAPSEDRIRARISDAIRAKTRAPAPVLPGRAEPPVVRRADAPPVSPAVSRAIAQHQARAAAEAPMRLAVSPGWPAEPATPPAPPRMAPPAASPAPMPAPEPDEALIDVEDERDLALPQRQVAPAWAQPADEDEDDDLPSWEAPQRAPQVSPGIRRNVVQHPERKPAAPSRQAQAEAQPRLKFDDRSAPAYEPPPLGLLTNPASIQRHHLSDEALEENARMLENVLDDYGVKGEIVSVRPGPVVTMYELEPAPGLKASRVIGLADDIARSMSALAARVSTVPGRSVIGIELPNAHREKVVLREILSARDFGDSSMRLPLALGKDIAGEPVVANLAKMPHLLIAGTTGSGKSVAINTMILSLLYKLTPEECRLIMIDPKMLELSVYDGIPHLLSPVVTDPKKAVVALKWVVGEMEERYRKMSKMGVRNIEGYNGRVREALAKGEMFRRTIQTGFDDETGDPVFETEEFAPVALPYIVVIVDEMADLMMVAGKEIEACIQRLAQMARASGIHLIMATQRPSVDVITGTIKANFPTRISFQVTSKIDSRTILGEMGAEQLLGMGDMLYMAGGGRISRIHGPFVSDEEVEEIVNHLKSFGPPSYMSGVVDGPDEEKAEDIDAVLGLGGGDNSEDALYDQAVAIVARDRKCSTSYIQRKLGIGYQKAARLVEQMEDQGVVTRANHVGKREILLPEQ